MAAAVVGHPDHPATAAGLQMRPWVTQAALHDWSAEPTNQVYGSDGSGGRGLGDGGGGLGGSGLGDGGGGLGSGGLGGGEGGFGGNGGAGGSGKLELGRHLLVANFDDSESS